MGIEIGGDRTRGENADPRRRESDQSDGIRPLLLEADEDLPAPVKAFYDLLADATERTAWVTRGNVEMVLRRDESKEKLFACLLNWNYREPLETEVVVRGEYSRVTDLSLPDGFPVPATVRGGVTRCPLLLGEGEGVVLRLQ